MRYRRRRLRMLFLIPIVLCFGLLLICIFIIYSPPRFIIHFISKVYPDVLFHIDLPSNLPYIALTIDDFPNAHDLSISFHLLDLLRTYNARCTFFTIGSNVEKYKDSSRIDTLFKRLIADGHEVGNHGWRDEQAIRLSQQELEQQINDTQKIINHYTIPNNKWFRPGSGFFNRTMIQICTNLGYQLVLGSIYPHDPQIPNARLNSFFIEHKLYPGGIIILHDRLATIDTLERVLPAIQRRKFHLVSLTELMKMKLNH